MKIKVDDFRTYRLAGIGERFGALLIDNILLAIIGGFVGIRGNFWAGGTLALLIGLAYHWFFLTHNDGQTLGKKIMGIRVVAAHGGKLTDIDAMLRYFGYYINSAIMGLGWIWALFDRHNQGWHDKLARTYVVVAREDVVDTVYVDKRKYGE